MDQELLKNRLISYLNREQVKQKLICEKIEISQDTLSRFKHGYIDLYPESASKLESFLYSRNY